MTCVRESYFTNDLILLRRMIVEANTGNSIPKAVARIHKRLEAA